jgi:hypothetical protein
MTAQVGTVPVAGCRRHGSASRRSVPEFREWTPDGAAPRSRYVGRRPCDRHRVAVLRRSMTKCQLRQIAAAGEDLVVSCLTVSCFHPLPKTHQADESRVEICNTHSASLRIRKTHDIPYRFRIRWFRFTCRLRQGRFGRDTWPQPKPFIVLGRPVA